MLKFNVLRPKSSARQVVDAEKEKESRSPVVDGVRGHAARTHQRASDNTPDPPDSTVKLYADELADHGYQLHDRLHAGVAGQIYRVSRLPRQPCDVTSSRQSAAKVGTRRQPVHEAVKIYDKRYSRISQRLNAAQEMLTHSIASQHFNVLTLHRVFNSRTAVYMIQELAARGNIASNIPPRGMPEAQCRQLMTGIVAGLQFIHKHNIVHRDLTCTNIFIDEENNAKIAEFGQALKLPSVHTEIIEVVVADEYKAPELLAGQPYNGFLADIWSIGVVMYFMLYNRPPYPGMHADPRHRHSSPDFSHRKLSVEARRVIARLLESNPTLRPTLRRLHDASWFTEAPDTPEILSTKSAGATRWSSGRPRTASTVVVHTGGRGAAIQSITLLSRTNTKSIDAARRLEVKAQSLRRVRWLRSSTSSSLSVSTQSLVRKLVMSPPMKCVEDAIIASEAATINNGELKRQISVEKHIQQNSAQRESPQSPDDAEPTQTSPAVSSTSVDVVHDVTVPGEPVQDRGASNRAAAAAVASTPTKPIYCTSSQCRLELRSERRLFDQPTSSVPLPSPRPPRSSVNLANIDED